MNVKYAHSVNIIFYVYKYIFKGRDKGGHVLLENGDDEITEYIQSRILPASECAWRIFNFRNHHRYPSVTALPVHLPGSSGHVYEEGKLVKFGKSGTGCSKLERYFARPLHEEFTKVTYREYYENYSLSGKKRVSKKTKVSTKKKAKKRRKKDDGSTSSDKSSSDDAGDTKMFWIDEWKGKPYYVYRKKAKRHISRLQMVMPSGKERYFLRWILERAWPRSFNDCRYYDGREFESYQACAIAAGFAGFDEECTELLKDLQTRGYAGMALRQVLVPPKKKRHKKNMFPNKIVITVQ